MKYELFESDIPWKLLGSSNNLKRFFCNSNTEPVFQNLRDDEIKHECKGTYLYLTESSNTSVPLAAAGVLIKTPGLVEIYFCLAELNGRTDIESPLIQILSGICHYATNNNCNRIKMPSQNSNDLRPQHEIFREFAYLVSPSVENGLSLTSYLISVDNFTAMLDIPDTP